MSLSSALNNVFAIDRQRARYGSERVQAQEEDGVASNEETARSSGEQDLESGISDAVHEQQRSSEASAGNNSEATRPNVSDEQEAQDDTGDGEQVGDERESVTADEFTIHGPETRGNTMTLAELEEQRELSRRRSSACVLLAVFVLFRLWIECLQKRDPTLLLLCLLGTSWTARWIRFNREREEELDRRIEAYLQNNNNTTEVDRNEFARLSFQAQLALAIMESQRHMMEGGYGRPDGAEELQSPGVSDEAQAQWKQFQWKASTTSGVLVVDKKGDYGAVPTKGNTEMDNHCSICLSEYEESEALTQLPCGHVFHQECIQAWTRNHVKCPLCNFDLERAVSSETASGTVDGESIV